MNQREENYLALRETYSHMLGKRWTGNRLFGCYEIIRDYYKEFLGRDLIDFISLHDIAQFFLPKILERKLVLYEIFSSQVSTQSLVILIIK